MKIEAIWNENHKKIEIEIVPYGLFVYEKDNRMYEIEDNIIAVSQAMLTEDIRKELEDYGGERPEGYIYYYAALHHFDGLVSYEKNQIMTLFPGDFTFKRMDIVKG